MDPRPLVARTELLKTIMTSDMSRNDNLSRPNLESSLSEDSAQLSARKYSWIDAKRFIIFMSILAILTVFFWFLVPNIQAQILPQAPGGKNGPWVVKPHWNAHVAASVFFAAMIHPLFMIPLAEFWEREDISLGSEWKPSIELPKWEIYIRAGLFLTAFSFGMLMYFASWVEIGPDGVDKRFLWMNRHFSFEDVELLEMVADGDYSESSNEYGPWYRIKSENGFATFGLGNEGLTVEDLSAIASFVSDKVQLVWRRKSDSRSVD
ncbi:MAG: hypothetical protein AAF939_07230 [Planctomycetota bacterium]